MPRIIPTDRHTLDEVARAVVMGERGLGYELDRTADDMARLMLNRLAASAAPGFHRVAREQWYAPRHWQAVSARYSPDMLKAILSRVDKYLASFAQKAKDA